MQLRTGPLLATTSDCAPSGAFPLWTCGTHLLDLLGLDDDLLAVGRHGGDGLQDGHLAVLLLQRAEDRIALLRRLVVELPEG